MTKNWNDEEEIQHPSYGLVQFNRCSNTHSKLFGSAIKSHMSTIRLRIFQNVKLLRGDSGDRYYTGNVPAIEVELSANQFAELVTTMNVGFGVPCTVRHLGNEIIEPPPELKTEAENVQNSFETRMRAAAKRLEEHVKDLPAKLEAAKIPKKHWEILMGPVNKMLQEVGLNSHFWLEMFEESTEKVVASAKAEIEAFQTSAIQQAGLKALNMDNGGPAARREARRALAASNKDDQ